VKLTNNIEGGQDGMDAVLIAFDFNKMKIQYSCANNSIIIIRNNELIELPKDKMPVGKSERKDDFQTFVLDIQKGDILYLYTDGYADQFGGEKGKKFKYANLNKLLLENSKLELSALNLKLETVFNEWKRDLEQVDDVCIIGIKL
jgi:serine phosphatase RsbU (regulator of sigma subunit)